MDQNSRNPRGYQNRRDFQSLQGELERQQDMLDDVLQPDRANRAERNMTNPYVFLPSPPLFTRPRTFHQQQPYQLSQVLEPNNPNRSFGMGPMEDLHAQHPRNGPMGTQGTLAHQDEQTPHRDHRRRFRATRDARQQAPLSPQDRLNRQRALQRLVENEMQGQRAQDPQIPLTHQTYQNQQIPLQGIEATRNVVQSLAQISASIEPPVPRPPPPPPPACLICTDQLPAKNLYRLPCSHTYCSDCLTQLFITSTQSLSAFPPKCCNREVHPHTYHSIIPDEVLKSYLHLSQVKRDNEAICCATEACNEQRIDPLHYHDEWALCDQCLELTCTKCGNLESSHPDSTTFVRKRREANATATATTAVTVNDADDDDEDINIEAITMPIRRIRICPAALPDPALQALAKSEKWQTCPKCKILVERLDGCAEMECRCGQIFCYSCGLGFSGIGRLCDCSSWPNRNIQGMRALNRDNPRAWLDEDMGDWGNGW